MTVRTLNRNGVERRYNDAPVREMINTIKSTVMEGADVISALENMREWDQDQLLDFASSALLEYNWLNRRYKSCFTEDHYGFLTKFRELRQQAKSSGVDLWPEVGEIEEPSQDLNSNIPRLLEWARTNFGPQEPTWPLLGVVEEVGELSRCFLKRHQGIRGYDDPVKFENDAKDAIGDIFVFLVVMTTNLGWDINEIVQTVTDEVTQRDWKTNPHNGITK